MFKCAFCGVSALPGQKPTKIVLDTDLRRVQYTNPIIDPETGKEVGIKVTSGIERTKEYDQCPGCGDLPTKQRVADLSPYVAVVRSLHMHASNCKKPLADCDVCQRNLIVYRGVPAQALSIGLSE